MPARTGFDVCFKHGAGTRKRQKHGAARPPGRPPLHGLYSVSGKASIAARAKRLAALDVDMDDTDAELRVMKAVNWYLLDEVTAVEDALDRVRRRDPGDSCHGPVADGASSVVPPECKRLLDRRDALLERVVATSLRIVTAIKRRAEIRLKLLPDAAFEDARQLVTLMREIVWDLLDEEQLDVFEQRLRREFFGPKGVMLEKPAHSKSGVAPGSSRGRVGHHLMRDRHGDAGTGAVQS